MTDVMPSGFEPRKSGRPPLVDPIPVYRRVERGNRESPGDWVAFTTYSMKQIRSLKIQLRRLGCEVSVSTTTAHSRPVLYARIKETR